MEKIEWQGQFLKMTTETIGHVTWERAYLPSGVVIFPITTEGKFLFIRERRPHENPPVRLKPVSGMLEAHESPLENAQRELQEEIGFMAREMKEFWVYKTSGTVNSVTHFYIATGLVPSKLPNPDGEDVIEEILELTADEVDHMIATEQIRWGVSTMGWFRLKLNQLSKHSS
jgi:ADP-ribose pyrophosphatase